VMVKRMNSINEDKMRSLVQQREGEVKEELEDIQHAYNDLLSKSSEEAFKLDKQRGDLKQEQEMLKNRGKELEKKEGEIKKQAEMYTRQYEQWQTLIETQKNRLEALSMPLLGTQLTLSMELVDKEIGEISENLLHRVEEAFKEHGKLTEDLVKRLESASRLQKTYLESQKLLQEKVDSMQKYLNVVEQQGMLPQDKHFMHLLKAAKRIARRKMNQEECFISYAWNVDKAANKELQKRLEKLKQDLRIAGVRTMLDIYDLNGSIPNYMEDNIAKCSRVLLICTPCLVSRVQEPDTPDKPNNLLQELTIAQQRQQASPKFIVPLIFEGTHRTSVPPNMKSILGLDMSDEEKYRDRMVSLNPKGLLPLLLDLDNDKDYQEYLEGYNAKMNLLKSVQ